MLGSLKSLDILVTGHSGFKGAWLSEVLIALGVNVHGLSLPPVRGSLHSRLGDTKFASVGYVDIRSSEEVSQRIKEVNPHLVFHLAAQPLVIKSFEHPRLTFETNVAGTVNVLEACRNLSKTRGVIVTTTDKIYLDVAKPQGYTEDDPLGGSLDPYSLSKVGTEMAIKAWQNLPAGSNCPRIVAVRSGNVIGGGDISEDRLVPDLIRAFRNNSPAVIRNKNAVRPWQHVLDAIWGYLLVAERLVEKRTLASSYNFGPGPDSKLTVEQVTTELASFWPGVNEWIHETSPGKLHESKYLWLDSSKAREELSWANLLGAVEALRWTSDWEKTADLDGAEAATRIQIDRYLELVR
jgi:CDP-glucose 4,6-dehydratase